MGIALKVDAFGGMRPAIDDRLLPQNAAAFAENAYLYSGKLQGTYQPTLLRNLDAPSATRVFRIPNNYTDSGHLNDATWLEFVNPDTDVLRAPVVGDTFDRYYWSSSSAQPKYNTLQRIKDGDNELLLGVPQPSNAPGVSVSGGSGITQARAYVYTWVTAYGEEGPPSTPTVVTGFLNGTWNLTFTAAATNDTNGTNRNITKVRAYRTVTGNNGVAVFYFVAEQVVSDTTYSDSATDASIVANNQLASTTWTAPPTDLEGWVAMPNGIIAGWRGTEVWFCEPYRPHAWPAQYAIACDYPIVGLGVVGQTLVICTQGYPQWAVGVHPSTMSLNKTQAVEPCLSRGSVVSAPEGVYYASPNGLMLFSNGQVVNITRKFLTKDKWLSIASIPTLHAVRLGTAYYAWGSGRTGVFEPTAWDPDWISQEDLSGAYTGVLIDLADDRVAVTPLAGIEGQPTFNVMSDPWSSEVFIVRAGAVYWLNIGDPNPTHEPYVWRSKVFQAPTRKNLGAFKVYFEVSDTLPPLNPVPNADLVQALESGQYGLIRLYASNGATSAMELVWTRELRTSGELMKGPAGFKADFYQVEINAYVSVYNLQVAEVAKDLAKV